MTNILFITGSLNQAGTEAFMMNVVKASNPSKFHYDFLITQQEKTYNSQLAEELGCHIYRIPSRRSSFCGYRKAIRAFFKLHFSEYNAIHFCGGSLTSIYSLLVAKRYGIKVRIIHSHSSEVKGLHNKILHKFHKIFVPFLGTHFFACSKLAGAFFFGEKTSNYQIIKNGIFINDYSYNEGIRREVRNELGIKNGEFVIGHVGRFDVVKNHSYIIDIFAEVKKKKTTSRLLLIGHGETEDEIKKKVILLGLEGDVEFLGLRNDVNRIYQAMDCFVMPSLFEGLPFVLVEAQTAGLPCFISDVIDKGTDITGNVIFKSIKANPSDWADEIKSYMNTYTRTKQDSNITKAGYNIHTTVQYLENIYSRC